MPSLFNYTVTIPDLVLLLLFMLATLCAAVIAYRKVSLQSRYDVILQEAQKRLGEKEEQLNRLNYSLKEKEQYVYSLQRSLAVMEETRNNLSDENDKLIKETSRMTLEERYLADPAPEKMPYVKAHYDQAKRLIETYKKYINI